MRKILGNLTKELAKHTTQKSVGFNPGYQIYTYRELVEQIAKLSFLNSKQV